MHAVLKPSMGLFDSLVYGSFFTLFGRYYTRAACEAHVLIIAAD
jgi:hypothetical protein